MTTPTLTQLQIAALRVANKCKIEPDSLAQLGVPRTLYFRESAAYLGDPDWANPTAEGRKALADHDAEISDALSALDELTELLVTPYCTIQKNAVAILRERLGVKC